MRPTGLNEKIYMDHLVWICHEYICIIGYTASSNCAELLDYRFIIASKLRTQEVLNADQYSLSHQATKQVSYSVQETTSSLARWPCWFRTSSGLVAVSIPAGARAFTILELMSTKYVFTLWLTTNDKARSAGFACFHSHYLLLQPCVLFTVVVFLSCAWQCFVNVHSTMLVVIYQVAPNTTVEEQEHHVRIYVLYADGLGAKRGTRRPISRSYFCSENCFIDNLARWLWPLKSGKDLLDEHDTVRRSFTCTIDQIVDPTARKNISFLRLLLMFL